MGLASGADAQPFSEEAVHTALATLGNVVELAQCPLAECFPELAGIQALNDRGRRLRSLLLEAIGALAPARPAPFGSSESRNHDVLTLRYVERMATMEMAEELSLSRRQVQRDLRRAEEVLTDLLHSWAQRSEARALSGDADDSLGTELAAYTSQPAQVQAGEALRQALETVGPLAESLGVHLHAGEGLDRECWVPADRAFLRALMVQVVSLGVQMTVSGEVRAGFGLVEDRAEVRVAFGASQSPELDRRLDSIRRAAGSEGIDCRVDVSDGEIAVALRLRPSVGAKVLVVEDNPGAIDLYRRYLAGTGWELHSITDPRLCLPSVRTNRPDVVILDIMMPHLEGWRVLRTLKESPDTASTPVVVCSVVEDPALAGALGAATYLRKPVSRSEFIAAISLCLRESPRRQSP